MIEKHIKPFLLAMGLSLLFGLAGCSSSSTTSSGSGTSGNALPQPSVNCGGSSCVD